MHIQYLINLGPKNFAYVGSGVQKLSGSASASSNVNSYISTVNLKLTVSSTYNFAPTLNITTIKFKPYDVGFDSNANQWKILEIFGVNGNFIYKACNGNNSKYFNEKDLFTESQIAQIYNTKVDNEINCLLAKYQDILN